MIETDPDRLTDLDVQVLALLPKEPLTCPIGLMAEDILGERTKTARGKIRRALNHCTVWLYVDYKSTRFETEKYLYGIRADRWAEAQALVRLKLGNLSLTS